MATLGVTGVKRLVRATYRQTRARETVTFSYADGHAHAERRKYNSVGVKGSSRPSVVRVVERYKALVGEW